MAIRPDGAMFLFSKVWLRLGLAHPWSPGPLVPGSPGPLVPWSSGPVVPWSSNPLVLVLWSLDPLVFGCGFWKDRNTANDSLWSF